MIALSKVCIWLCRLQQQGIRVLVEKPVHRTEFPEFDAFDAENDGTTAQLDVVTRVFCDHVVLLGI